MAKKYLEKKKRTHTFNITGYQGHTDVTPS